MAGIGGEEKRSRNSHKKWTLAFPGKHEPTERLSSTERNGTSCFAALVERRAEQGVKVARFIPRFGR